MSGEDRELLAALKILGQGQTDSAAIFRDIASTNRVTNEKLGRLCDNLEDFMRHINERQTESESKIRVLDRKVQDVLRRFEPVEEAYKAAAREHAAGAPRR